MRPVNLPCVRVCGVDLAACPRLWSRRCAMDENLSIPLQEKPTTDCARKNVLDWIGGDRALGWGCAQPSKGS